MTERSAPGFIEPFYVSSVYCDGLAMVDMSASGNARLTLFAEQGDAHTGHVERIVVARLIIPQVALAEAIARLQAACSGSAPKHVLSALDHVGGHA